MVKDLNHFNTYLIHDLSKENRASVEGNLLMVVEQSMDSLCCIITWQQWWMRITKGPLENNLLALVNEKNRGCTRK